MRLSSYYHQDYSGGLNDTASARQIKRNEASLLHDWDITYQGQLKKRPGLLEVGDNLSNAIVGLHGYLRSNGGKDLLLMEGTTLRYLNSTTWTALDSGFTTGLDTWMVTCPLNDKVYIDNGTDYTHSWDRGSTTLNSCLTDMGTAIPHGKVRIWHKNHMFALNAVTVSGTTYYDRMYWSAMADPDTYDTVNDFINVPGGGHMITACDLGDSLVLFKENSISFLSGWGDTDWTITASASNVTNIDESVGCVAKRGVTRVGNEIWFIDDEGLIRRIYQTDFDAFRKDLICSKIRGTLATINTAQLTKALAWTHNDKVYFAVPTGSSTVNNTLLVYDILASKRTGEEAWTTYTGWTPAILCSYPSGITPDLYIGSNSATGKIWKHTGDDDDGTAIDSRWDGRDDDYDKPEKWKRYKYGYITGPSSSDIDVAIHASVDSAPFADLGDLNLAGSGSRLGPTGSFLLGPTGGCQLGGSGDNEKKFYFSSGGGAVRGKRLKMSIRHSVLDESPTVNGYTVHFKQRNLR